MTESSWLERIAERPELDELAAPLQRPLRDALERHPALGDFLHGSWLGHPLHAAATDVPVGAFTTSLVLDGLAAASKNRALETAADATLAIGLVAALVAAAPGMADWSAAQGPARRMGLVHGVANLGATGLYSASLIARRKGKRALGIQLAGAGFGLLLLSAWLGGDLAYRLGVGRA